MKNIFISIFILALLLIQLESKKQRTKKRQTQQNQNKKMKRQLEFQSSQKLFKFKQSKKTEPKTAPPITSNTKDNNLQQKFEQLKEDNKNNTQAKEKEKKVEKVEVAKDMHSLKSINNTFVNSSRALPDRFQKIPGDWNDASYVKQISTYSKKFLRDLNDPRLKNKAFLVGKNVYLENDIVFDQQPAIIQDVSPVNVGVDVVQRDQNTQEKVNLWRQFFQQEFKQNYKDVSFNQNLTQALEDLSGIEQVIKDKSVRVSLQNKFKAIQQLQKQLAQGQQQYQDKVLQNTINPIKPIVFTKDKVDNIKFDSEDYHQHIKNTMLKSQPPALLRKLRLMKQLATNNNKTNTNTNNNNNNNNQNAFEKFIQQANYLNSLNLNKNKVGVNKVVPPSGFLFNSKIYQQFLANQNKKRFKLQMNNK